MCESKIDRNEWRTKDNITILNRKWLNRNQNQQQYYASMVMKVIGYYLNIIIVTVKHSEYYVKKTQRNCYVQYIKLIFFAEYVLTFSVTYIALLQYFHFQVLWTIPSGEVMAFLLVKWALKKPKCNKKLLNGFQNTCV